MINPRVRHNRTIRGAARRPHRARRRRNETALVGPIWRQCAVRTPIAPVVSPAAAESDCSGGARLLAVLSPGGNSSTPAGFFVNRSERRGRYRYAVLFFGAMALRGHPRPSLLRRAILPVRSCRCSCSRRQVGSRREAVPARWSPAAATRRIERSACRTPAFALRAALSPARTQIRTRAAQGCTLLPACPRAGRSRAEFRGSQGSPHTIRRAGRTAADSTACNRSPSR